jgi:CheY-like chemotaxis protein
MKVLLVEDDENKRTQISAFVREAFPNLYLHVERSLQSGLRNLKIETPDLVLLDMTLPNYDPGPDEPGGQPQIFGGREFLRQMDRFDIVVPAIVITQFGTFGKGSSARNLDDLDSELRSVHGQIYRGAIYYNAAIHGWKEQLKAVMSAVLGEGGAECCR